LLETLVFYLAHLVCFLELRGHFPGFAQRIILYLLLGRHETPFKALLSIM
jgi:hypothetical protein